MINWSRFQNNTQLWTAWIQTDTVPVTIHQYIAHLWTDQSTNYTATVVKQQRLLTERKQLKWNRNKKPRTLFVCEQVSSADSLKLADGRQVSFNGGSSCEAANCGSAESETVTEQLPVVAERLCETDTAVLWLVGKLADTAPWLVWRLAGTASWLVWRLEDVLVWRLVDVLPASDVAFPSVKSDLLATLSTLDKLWPTDGPLTSVTLSTRWSTQWTTASTQIRRMPGVAADIINSPEGFW